jgi:glutamate-1-semialdehyde 2,1-aminomutase
MLTLTKSHDLFDSASKVLPQGVTSNFRYWGPKATRYLQGGKGAHVWDVDGNDYIDYRLGYGPALLGHSDDRVDNAVIEAIRSGQTFSMSLPIEQQVATKITQMMPSIEMVRFANSGTEATMHALRLARAYTRRQKFIMFEGQYHGAHDSVMFTPMVRNDWITTHRRSPVAVPVSSGVPDVLSQLVIMLPYNDPETLTRILKQTWQDVAAILIEPILGNCSGITPEPGWLETVRALCDEYGIVLIMDEVKTGFRLGRGGGQEVFGVKADLTTLAKALGNGYPVAAFGGKREIMSMLGEGVVHGGTYCGNRVAMAAANATLDIYMNTDALDTVIANGRELQSAFVEILDRSGMPYVILGHPSLFTFAPTDKKPKDFRDWLMIDRKLYERITEAMIERNVLPEPDIREPFFISAALTTQDIAKTAEVLEDSLREVLGKK